MKLVTRSTDELIARKDCAEGIAAFLDKRAPVYQRGNPVDKRAEWHGK